MIGTIQDSLEEMQHIVNQLLDSREQNERNMRRLDKLCGTLILCISNYEIQKELSIRLRRSESFNVYIETLEWLNSTALPRLESEVHLEALKREYCITLATFLSNPRDFSISQLVHFLQLLTTIGKVSPLQAADIDRCYRFILRHSTEDAHAYLVDRLTQITTT